MFEKQMKKGGVYAQDKQQDAMISVFYLLVPLALGLAVVFLLYLGSSAIESAELL